MINRNSGRILFTRVSSVTASNLDSASTGYVLDSCTTRIWKLGSMVNTSPSLSMNPLTERTAPEFLRLKAWTVCVACAIIAPVAITRYPPKAVVWNCDCTALAPGLTLVNVVLCVNTQEKAPAPGLVLAGTDVTVATDASACDMFLVLAAAGDTDTVEVIALAPTRLLEIALAVVKLAVMPNGSISCMPGNLPCASTVKALEMPLAPCCNRPPVIAIEAITVTVAVPLVGGITSAVAAMLTSLETVLAPNRNWPPFTATLALDTNEAVPLVGGITSAAAATLTLEFIPALAVLCSFSPGTTRVACVLIVAPVVLTYPP